MNASDAIAILRANADALRALGVAHVSLFGSIARDEAHQASDIDLIVAGPPERPITLLRMARAQEMLERLFGRPVDLTAAQSLAAAKTFRDRIAPDVITVF